MNTFLLSKTANGWAIIDIKEQKLLATFQGTRHRAVLFAKLLQELRLFH